MTRDSQPLIETHAVTKVYRRRDGTTFRAVDGVDLKIHEQECVALVGESGSGKSTFARLILRLTLPDGGDVLFKGRPLNAMTTDELRAFRQAVQPIFQDPGTTFNPVRNVRRTLAQALRQAKDAHRSGDAAAADLLAQVKLTPPGEYLRRYPHELSGGQRQRLAIARALALSPQLIIADEPLSGADASIRGQILNLLSDLKRDRHVAYLLITHDISLARSFAQRVAIMYRGGIVEEGGPEVLTEPEHPYTRLLLASAPTVDGGLNLERARGSTARDDAGAACSFYGRCPRAQGICRTQDPQLRHVGSGRSVACHFADDCSSPPKAEPALRSEGPA